jgi:hypothetical protein
MKRLELLKNQIQEKKTEKNFVYSVPVSNFKKG